MYIDWSTIITAGSVVGAIATILTFVLKWHKWVIKQDEQLEETTNLRKQHEEDIHRLKKENALVCYALSACLDGLMQLGANHSVPIAKEKLDKYLNQQAHE